mgnify:CR=1 FL=1|tara:strand:- start:22260 stop:23384 length:1125 start_codon:yes stop_codon:yes gene_type:complete
MKIFPEGLQKKIMLRKDQNSFRRLSTHSSLIDFSSNDYLGFSKNKSIQEAAKRIIDTEKFINGSTGSRLVSGSHSLHYTLERYLAGHHHSEAALLYNSGYDANLGLFSSILQKGDTVIYDELIHASIRDGIRMSNANSYKFKHNSMEDLEKKFSRSTGTIYIAIESVYSMDGDTAPLKKMASFSKKNNCYLIVDEAHSTGVFGEYGRGMLEELELENEVFARIHTFGKAMGCHGAVVLGSQDLRDYLINFSRSFIYSTAASLHSVATIQASYLELKKTDAIEKLTSNISYFNKRILKHNLTSIFVESSSAIHCCIFPGNDVVKTFASLLQEKGFDIKPILSPTVPAGKERLRICLHSYNTHEEIDALLTLLATL